MDKSTLCCFIVCVIALAAYSSLIEAYEDDTKWLENVVNAPRATFNVGNRWNSRNKRHSPDMDELLLQNIMLNQFYSQAIRNSRRKRSLWFTDDPLNRATDTTVTRPTTTSPTSQTTPTPTTTPTTTTPAPRKTTLPSLWGRIRFRSPWGKRRRRSVVFKTHKDEYESD